MDFDEIEDAVDEAKRTMNIADRLASRMAGLLVGRLRYVNIYTLKKLKRELQDFNSTTYTWKGQHD